jgi:hypothetical protein
VSNGTDSILPASLKDVWDDDIAAKFGALSMGEQTFCLELLKGSRKGDAYKAGFPNVSDESRGACASGLLKRPKIISFLEEFRNSNLEDLFLIRHRLQCIVSGEIIQSEMLTEEGTKVKVPIIPKVRDITAAAAQLAKLSGLNAPEEVKIDAGEAMREFLEKLKGGA